MSDYVLVNDEVSIWVATRRQAKKWLDDTGYSYDAIIEIGDASRDHLEEAIERGGSGRAMHALGEAINDRDDETGDED